jgi:DNA excision repair protein ERCC-5
MHVHVVCVLPTCAQAEAQCAWLNEAGLVDGVVTDDNDVFLFGGRHVYRNIFADKKWVAIRDP